VDGRDIHVALTELKPSLYTDEQGKPSGFFVELIEDCGAEEEWNIIWVSGSLYESWNRLDSGEIDLLPAVTITSEREHFYDFTNESALSIWSQVYARPDSGISTILDLDGKLVAMVRGASSGIAFRDYAQKFAVNATYLEKNTPKEVFSAVAAQEADALVVYNSAGQEDSLEYGLIATPVMFNPALFGFAVKKGKNQDLLKSIDKYLADGKKNPSSTYSLAMQKWYGIKTEELISPWLWWVLEVVAGLAALFLIMSYILRREVRRKTFELARQNEELQSEIKSRIRAEADLLDKNKEVYAAYEQLAAMDNELRENFLELRKNEKALMEARKKLSLLNALTFKDIKNTFFILSGYIQLSKDAGSIEEAQFCFTKEEQILHSVEVTLSFIEKYQNLGINQPKWQKILYVLLNAISHLDFSKISRTVDLPELEIYADPLLEDVFLAIMNTITQEDSAVTHVSIRCQQNMDGIIIMVESDGTGIPKEDKENIFSWEQAAVGGTSLFLAREILSITNISLQETGEPDTGIRFEITVPKGEYRISDA